MSLRSCKSYMWSAYCFSSHPKAGNFESFKNHHLNCWWLIYMLVGVVTWQAHLAFECCCLAFFQYCVWISKTGSGRNSVSVWHQLRNHTVVLLQHFTFQNKLKKRKIRLLHLIRREIVDMFETCNKSDNLCLHINFCINVLLLH